MSGAKLEWSEGCLSATITDGFTAQSRPSLDWGQLSMIIALCVCAHPVDLKEVVRW